MAVETMTSAVEAMSVAEALALVDRAVTAAVPNEVWVQGEVNGLYRSPAGHLYCTLHGDGARLPVCALGRDARSIVSQLSAAGVALTDGQQVRLRGRLGCYAARGTVQLRASSIDPAITVGGAELARRRLQQTLVTERASERQRTLELALVPQRVWLVGPEGDGIEDFLDVLTGSPWAWDVIFLPTISEGPVAPEAIAATIAAAPPETQVIVLARGGGTTATVAYDSELVARAVCAAGTPVITAVGHSADRSVADDCAWQSVATPTAAAELLCRRLAVTASAIESRLEAIGAASNWSLAQCRADLDARVTAIAQTAIHTSTRQKAARADISARRARRVVVALAVLAAVLTAIVLIGVLQ